MSYRGPVDHLFLYHAYALALGGWVRDKQGRFTPIDSIAPSVLSITGGFGSAVAHNRNLSLRDRSPFGDGGPNEFYIYVGHAYTEVRGVETEDPNPFGTYRTTVRSVLDDVRINDVLAIEHAEAVLVSTHPRPGSGAPPSEAQIVIGDSNIAGASVLGVPVTLTRHNEVDRVPTYEDLHLQVKARQELMLTAGKGGESPDSWLDELCDWHDPSAVPEGSPDYARDIAAMNQRAQTHLRYSLYKSAEIPETKGARPFKSSIDVDNFGRIFFGEVFASHGTKQVAMFRLDLGCDNCGGVGGSSGSTNGSTYPP